MFIGFHAEIGGEHKAATALVPQIVGNIQTVAGCATLQRANGIAAQVVVGEPVCQGDVIETAADGAVGIRFIDGTVFNLSADTRAVVNEFGRDADGAAHSALLEVARGTFAFVGGETARAGSLRIDTPFGSIRGRTHGAGVGMLSLAALVFSALHEAQAADPNATYLDDDNIAYKDLAHGSFELVTKEAVPRHIIVEDPGQTVVLSKTGSSVSVNQVTNTPARMEELQALQQDVLANFAKGLGPGGSSTPPFGSSLPVQPINFVQPDAPAGLNSLPPLLVTPAVIQETPIVRPPPTPPLFTIASGPVETDTVIFDTFTATNGTFSASSANNGTLTFGISGGAASNTVLGGVTYDVADAGSFGTLFVDSATGAYTFVPNSDAINALTEPTTQTFVVTVSDGTLSTNQTFTININGVNDAAIISGATTGAVIEAGTAPPSGTPNGTGAAPLGTLAAISTLAATSAPASTGTQAAPGTLSATGALTNTDVDNAPNTFTAVSAPEASTGGFGTFTITVGGVWTYTLDNTNHTVQALNVGDTLTDSFTVTTVDGTPQVVTLTIRGSNDAAIVGGGTSGFSIEASGVANSTSGAPIATGKLTDTDVDNTPDTFTAVDTPTASHGGYGTFTIASDGTWTYTLDNTNHTVQALNVNDTLTDTFTVTTIDGTPQLVTVTVRGSNDTAVISGVTAGSVIEAGGCNPGKQTATGALSDTDVDNTPNTFMAISQPKESTGGYGTFTITADGCWTYTLDNTNHAVQALNVCDTLTDTFTVTTIDGTPQVVTITIHGTNDAAIISGATAGSVIEAGGYDHGTPRATGTLTDTDVDNTPNTFTEVSCPTASDHGYGSFTMTAAGVWTYTLDNSNCVVQALEPCDTLTDCFTVTTIDGTAQVITITIHGTSDGDPNDFDYLATGRHVTSDPPFVYGTRGDDCITGGGHYGQIIYAGAGDDTVNGTGRDDTIYAGSGDDTVKGNDACDTIYGGSGNDTINANNGDDTIIGGFGRDCLTGGNGCDSFVYLSAADSNARRFDTITDFRSGSDRIDLTALGALGLLALTSTSTSVPAHTIAWFYDSDSNETIVYVNPTDQTLRIGNSDLVEIHLQGIATVQASDFVYEPEAASVMAAHASIDAALAAPADNDATMVAMTTADASFNFTDGGAVPGNATARTADVGASFDADRGHLDHVVASVGSNGAGTSPTEHSDDQAAIVQASAEPVEPHHAHATARTESSFAFAQTPLLDSALNNTGTTVPNAANDQSTLRPTEHGRTLHDDGPAVPSHNDWKYAGTSNDDDEQDGGSGNAHGAGTHPASEHNEPANLRSMAHSYEPWSRSDDRSACGGDNQRDAAPVHNVDARDFDSSSHSWFDSGHANARGYTFHFKDAHSDFAAYGDRADADADPTSTNHRGHEAGSNERHAMSDDTQAIESALPDHHGNQHFNFGLGHMGNANFAHGPHELMA